MMQNVQFTHTGEDARISNKSPAIHSHSIALSHRTRRELVAVARSQTVQTWNTSLCTALPTPHLTDTLIQEPSLHHVCTLGFRPPAQSTHFTASFQDGSVPGRESTQSSLSQETTLTTPYQPNASPHNTTLRGPWTSTVADPFASPDISTTSLIQIPQLKEKTPS